MRQITIQNSGPSIVSTNYWESDLERVGKLYFSVNAGAIRALLPRALFSAIDEWRKCEFVIVSVGPWPELSLPKAVEFLFEDHSATPYVLHLTPQSFDFIPGDPGPDGDWTFTAWVEHSQRPHCVLEKPVRWRRVSKIPDLSSWMEKV